MTKRTLATLIYAQHNGRVPMLHRKQEPKQGLWIAPGGKLELDESPQECALRELAEETGLRGRNPQLVGLITKVSPRQDYQWLIFIFITRQITGDLLDCESADWPGRPLKKQLHWLSPRPTPSFFRTSSGIAPFFAPNSCMMKIWELWTGSDMFSTC